MNDLESLKIIHSGLISPRRWNALVTAVQSSLVVAFPGGAYARTTGGTSLWIRPIEDSPPAASVQAPWDIINLTGVGSAVDGVFPNYTANIWPGTVMGLIASNIFDDFSFTSALTYFKAGCTSDGKVVTSVTIYVDTTPPDHQNAAIDAMPDNFDIVFGLALDGKTYRTIGASNPVLTQQKILSVPKATLVAGLSVYDNYYIWGIS